MAKDILQTMIDEDNFCYTPDLVHLRYRGPYFVFLWDDMVVGKVEDTLLYDMTDAKWDIEFRSAVTKDPFYCFDNLDQSAYRYSNYIFRDKNFLDNCNIPGYYNTISRRVKGTLIKGDHNLIVDLDRNYYNTEAFRRVEIEVYSSVYSITPIKAYAYISTPRGCFNLSSSGKHRLLSGIDLLETSVKVINKEEIYETEVS